ncbi:MAG: flagellar basal body-associated FliL family protein [Firmicutes bacterium]|jgi:flagellar basal body-associated protein FliL|nr:flagellar basal body-associated FliL family protein [Bacillota bacterium]
MKKILIISIVALLSIVLIGGALFFFVFRDSGEKEVVVEYFEFDMGEMYLNIESPKNILKLQPVIEYTNQETLPVFEKNKNKLNNYIRELFATKTYEEILDKKGIEKTREDVHEIILEVLELDSDTITNVYFVQFIVQ